MMHSNWLQVELKELLARPRHEGVAWQFVKKLDRNWQCRKEDKAKEDTKSKVAKHRSERSSGYSINHEQVKENEERDTKC